MVFYYKNLRVENYELLFDNYLTIRDIEIFFE